MKRILSFWVVFAGLGAIFSSCVPTSQLREVEARAQRLTMERDSLYEANERFSVENAEMRTRLDKLEDELSGLNKEMTETSESYEKLSDEYQHLSRQYDDLQQSQDALLKGHTRETRRLLTQLQKTQEDLQLKEDRLVELEKSVGDKMHEVERLRAELEAQNQHLIEMERILYSKDSLMRALKNTLSDALYGFKQDGLTVSIKGGKVYVSMEEELLFQTGSIEVDPKGVSALKQVGAVLERNPDIFITIEGHTDDVPVRSNPSFTDNWDLSVKRATSIVRILLDNSSIDPKRLIASGRGEYLPVDPTDSDSARRKNRRTEIILTPNLDELYQILEGDQ
jgi:chemotaxis protein MotB